MVRLRLAASFRLKTGAVPNRQQPIASAKTSLHRHYRNNADLAEFKECFRDCPNARAVAQELIFLPTYPRYALGEVERTIRVIRQFFDGDTG